MSGKKRKGQSPAAADKTVTAAPVQDTAPAAEAAQVPEEDQKTEGRRKLHKRYLRMLRDLLFRVLAFLLVIYILFVHLVGLTVMPNGDMYPRIDAGDLVLFYRLEHNHHAQDVIVFDKPTAFLEQTYEGGEAEIAARREKTAIRRALDWLGFKDPADPPMTRFVCRVVAGPGDTVEISESERLVVNGNTLIETNIFYNTPEYAGLVEYPLTLGEGQYFVLADHRNGGADSRFFGAVNADEIKGTVITILRRNNL